MPTLRELLERGEFKYGTDYRNVESDKQTVSEFEQNGLRPNRLNLGTNLYGVDTLRITRQSTSILDDMKANTNANQGLLGGVIGAVREKVNNFASKLGFPVLQIPTRVSNDNRLEKAIQGVGKDNIPEALAKIKEGGSGGALGILGKFLTQSAKGTPDQIGRRALGTAANIGKDLAKGLLFGTGQGGENLVQNQTLSLSSKDIKYGSDKNKKYSFQLRRRGGDELGLYTILNEIQDGELDFTFTLPKQVEDQRNRPNIGNKEGEDKWETPYFPKFPKFSVKAITQNIPGKRDKTNRYLDDLNSVNLFRIDKDTIGKFKTTSDIVNLYGVWDGDVEGNPTEQIVDNKTIDELDFIPLRFYSVGKQKGVSFKATLNGITENFAPSWESSNFIGNPYSFYTYQTISRDLTFSFSIYSLSGNEHKKNWEKIDFLSSLTYPQNTTNDVYVTPPLLKITMGNMYKNKLGFFESLSYTIDDNTPWEIGIGAEKTEENDILLNDSMKSYKLPKIINVSITYKFIETSKDVVGQKLYNYGFADPAPQSGDFSDSQT